MENFNTVREIAKEVGDKFISECILESIPEKFWDSKVMAEAIMALLGNREEEYLAEVFFVKEGGDYITVGLQDDCEMVYCVYDTVNHLAFFRSEWLED